MIFLQRKAEKTTFAAKTTMTMHRKSILLLVMLTLLGLASATAQKTIVSKKTPVTPPQGGMDMAGMPPSEDMELSLILLGDSCMDSYDTHAALAYYQQAYNESQTFGEQPCREYCRKRSTISTFFSKWQTATVWNLTTKRF